MSAALLRGCAILLVTATAAFAQGQPSDVEWPTYHGDHTGRHYSPLTQITTANAKNLSLAWIYRLNISTAGAIMGGSVPSRSRPPVAASGLLGAPSTSRAFHSWWTG